jgi:hypothetical protein
MNEIGRLMKTIAAILILPCCLQSCRALGQDNVAISAAEAACGPRGGADGKWMGALKRGTYFSISIDLGEHHLCAIGHIGELNPVSLHELRAKGTKLTI